MTFYLLPRLTMLERADIEQNVHEAAIKLSKEHPQHTGHVAAWKGFMERRLRTTLPTANNRNTVHTPRAFFEAIDGWMGTENYVPDVEITQQLDTQRAEQGEELLQLFFQRAMKNVCHNPEEAALLQAQRTVCVHLIPWIRTFRQKRPESLFGPEWLEDNCSEAMWEDVCLLVFDPSTGMQDWSRFVDLLPEDIAKQFDPQLTRISLPQKITSAEEGVAIVHLIAARHNCTIADLLHPARVAEILGEGSPAMKLVLQFGRMLKEQQEDKKPYRFTPSSSS